MELISKTNSTSETKSVIPLNYYRGFLEYLSKNSDSIEIITYNDLPWGDDYDYKINFPDERKKWINEIRDKNSIYLLIQHDVDAYPELTEKMLRLEEKFGIRSNVFVFNRKIDREALQVKGEVRYTGYNVNWQYLKQLEQNGVVIGYHTNAYEQSEFDNKLAQQIFLDDLKELREKYDVRYFSAHGGVRDSRGYSNVNIALSDGIIKSARWVHNRYGVRFDYVYTDGGAVNRKYPYEMDLVKFTQQMKPGNRYRVLIHPQYFNDEIHRSNNLSGYTWYEKAIHESSDNKGLYHLWQEKKYSERSLWQLRIRNKLKKVADNIISLPSSSISDPVFVHGLSRSGTTLLVTLLDSHPEISMSYELFPGIMEISGKGKSSVTSESIGTHKLLQYLWAIYTSMRIFPRKLRNRNLRVLVSRLKRSGLTFADFVRVYLHHYVHEMTFDIIYGKLKAIEKFAMLKMKNENKHIWGVKCTDQFKSYHELWPEARFINIIRDGRDILASQLNTGNFKPVPAKLAEQWSSTYQEFSDFGDKTGAHIYAYRYEDLVREPSKEIKKICEFLGVQYSDDLSNYYEKDLTIYQASHISMNRITKPMDTSQIGRWKNDLSDEQVNEFESVAGDALKRYGYY